MGGFFVPKWMILNGFPIEGGRLPRCAKEATAPRKSLLYCPMTSG